MKHLYCVAIIFVFTSSHSYINVSYVDNFEVWLYNRCIALAMWCMGIRHIERFHPFCVSQCFIVYLQWFSHTYKYIHITYSLFCAYECSTVQETTQIILISRIASHTDDLSKYYCLDFVFWLVILLKIHSAKSILNFVSSFILFSLVFCMLVRFFSEIKTTHCMCRVLLTYETNYF